MTKPLESKLDSNIKNSNNGSTIISDEKPYYLYSS